MVFAKVLVHFALCRGSSPEVDLTSSTPLVASLRNNNLMMVQTLWVYLNFDHCKHWVDKHKKGNEIFFYKIQRANVIKALNIQNKGPFSTWGIVLKGDNFSK